MELVKYETACRAVAEAKTIDEVKEIGNRAEAARAYARQAKNREMEKDAIEIRVRAERRLGELITMLKVENVIVVGGPGRGRHESPSVTLKDIGISSNISAASQRLAALPLERFENEIGSWRTRAETSVRLETPLQAYRKPTVHADREKARQRSGRTLLNAGDAFDKFRSLDGRRVVDWRKGELRRMADLGRRLTRCAEAFETEMPVANPDPLATMEMIFRPETLLTLLAKVWEAPVDCGDAGLNQNRIDEARTRRTARCENENCGAEFVKRNPSGKARRGESNEGRFCSRACAHAAARKSSEKCGT